MYFHAKNINKIDISLILFISLAMWFFVPSFGETVFWATGSCVYLWEETFILIILLPYKIHFLNKGYSKNNKFKMICMLILGIIAGWSNETSAIALILITTIYLIYYKYNKLNITKWAIFGLIGVILGFMFLICAPGNYVRMQS